MTNPDELLAEFQGTLTRGGKKRKAAFAESVGLMWEYLYKTPGEQRPYVDFGKMLGVNDSSASSRLSILVKHGIITKTSMRKGSGGGVGFVCNWLEKKRNEVDASEASEPSVSTPTSSVTTVARNGRDVAAELSSIDVLAERAVQSMRLLLGRESPLGLAMVETLREIQTHVSRAMSGIASK